VIGTFGNGQNTGIRQETSWDIIEFHFEDDCLVVEKLHACKEL